MSSYNDLQRRKNTVDAYSPAEVTEILACMGMYKKNQHIDVIIRKSFLAGVFLSFSGACKRAHVMGAHDPI